MAFDISKFAATIQPVSDSDTVLELPVTDIRDNPRNFYPAPAAEELQNLMSSIEANGLLEPPTVVPAEDGTYRLISGHSRMLAVRTLRAEYPEDSRWKTVLCRVLPPMSESAEVTAVIEANRQRVKGQELLAQEAEVLTKAYRQRRDAGEHLPGRIRDLVASAMNVNPTKLANLSAIKNGIKVPGILRHWEADEIPEAAALLIARMDIDEQYRLLDWTIDTGARYTVRNVQKFKLMWTMCKHHCPKTDGFCPNAERMIQEWYQQGEFHCAGCCRQCLRMETCSTACKFCQPKADAPQSAAAPEPTPIRETVNDIQPATDALSPWQALDQAHWPERGMLVVLSCTNDLGGNFYRLGRCTGIWSEQFPFDDPNSGLSMYDFADYGFDRWLEIAEAVRAK